MKSPADPVKVFRPLRSSHEQIPAGIRPILPYRARKRPWTNPVPRPILRGQVGGHGCTRGRSDKKEKAMNAEIRENAARASEVTQSDPHHSTRARRMRLFPLTVMAASLACRVVSAAPEIYFGEDVSPYPYPGPNDVPRPTELPNTYAAAAEFSARLPGAVSETFETYDTNSPGALAVRAFTRAPTRTPKSIRDYECEDECEIERGRAGSAAHWTPRDKPLLGHQIAPPPPAPPPPVGLRTPTCYSAFS